MSEQERWKQVRIPVSQQYALHEFGGTGDFRLFRYPAGPPNSTSTTAGTQEVKAGGVWEPGREWRAGCEWKTGGNREPGRKSKPGGAEVRWRVGARGEEKAGEQYG